MCWRPSYESPAAARPLTRRRIFSPTKRDFDIDEEQVFAICKKDVPELITVVRTMLADLRRDVST
jgi:hypothetical protein